MKICTKCKRQALITHEDKDLCVRHFNLLPDKEDKPKPKKEVNNAYILL